MVPGAGIEPARPKGREILSLLRLPISPPGLSAMDHRWPVLSRPCTAAARESAATHQGCQISQARVRATTSIRHNTRPKTDSKGAVRRLRLYLSAEDVALCLRQSALILPSVIVGYTETSGGDHLREIPAIGWKAFPWRLAIMAFVHQTSREWRIGKRIVGTILALIHVRIHRRA